MRSTGRERSCHRPCPPPHVPARMAAAGPEGGSRGKKLEGRRLLWRHWCRNLWDRVWSSRNRATRERNQIIKTSKAPSRVGRGRGGKPPPRDASNVRFLCALLRYRARLLPPSLPLAANDDLVRSRGGLRLFVSLDSRLFCPRPFGHTPNLYFFLVIFLLVWTRPYPFATL